MLPHQLEMYGLIQQLSEANDVYHAGGTLLMTDEEYDVMRMHLIGLEKMYPYDVLPNSFTNKVGHKPTGSTIKHIRPMLSLDNVFSENGLLEFISNINSKFPKCHISIEDKLDGMACSLHYEDGVLKYAVSRGDGIEGEDITNHIYYVENVPKVIENTTKFEVRGEIVMSKSDMEIINKELILNDEKPLKSTRNAAVGAMKSKDPTMAAKRKCQFIAYDVYGLEGPIFTHDVAMMHLDQLGFKTTSPMVVEAYTFIRYPDMRIYSERLKDQSLDIAIDGIVFKVNEYHIQEELGFNNTAPHWAIAFKSNDMVVETKLNDVTWQVGRTGVITPVGHIDPVSLPTADITNVTLHNHNFIESLDLCIGDVIGIIRSGQVIPKVVSVVARNQGRRYIAPPMHCPTCYAEIRSDGAFMKCTNVFHCRGAIAERLIWAASDSCVEIKGIGDEIIKELVEQKLIKCISDLYKDSMAQLLADRCPNTADNRLSEFQKLISDARVTTRERAISALSIPNIGVVSARTLAAQIDRLTDLLKLTHEELEVVDIKGIKAAYFFAAMELPYYRDLIAELDKLFIFEERIMHEPFLEGINFVVSGSFSETLTRANIEEIILRHKGKLQSKVSSKTNYLILGEGGGSKAQDAIRHRVETISDIGFKNLLMNKAHNRPY